VDGCLQRFCHELPGVLAYRTGDSYRCTGSRLASVLFAIAAVLIARSLSGYLLVPVSNLFAENIPVRWRHVMVWGGLRGALALALTLSLDNTFPYRGRLLDLTFGVRGFLHTCTGPYHEAAA